MRREEFRKMARCIASSITRETSKIGTKQWKHCIGRR